jgi:hypothetical protein
MIESGCSHLRCELILVIGGQRQTEMSRRRNVHLLLPVVYRALEALHSWDTSVPEKAAQATVCSMDACTPPVLAATSLMSDA